MVLSGRLANHGDVSIVAMALSGYTHLQLWRLGVLPCLNIVKGSGWAYYHPNIHVMDIIVAHVLVKSVSVFASFVVIYTIMILFGILDPPRDPALIVAAYGLDTLFVLSFATWWPVSLH